MKIDRIKALIIILASALLGWLCYENADSEDCRDTISFAISFISILLCTGSAFACNYNGYRSVNIKVVAWIFSALVILMNIIFSSITYNVPVYIIVISLITLLNVAVIYALSQVKKH